jgi:hypothetical protein
MSVIDKPLLKLVEGLNRLNIDYVVVGAIAVIIHGRVRTTMVIDIIINHEQIEVSEFVNTLQSVGFDISINDMKNLEEQLHVSFFCKENMFRIDMKGIYEEKDREAITEAIIVEYKGRQIPIDSPVNLVLNKLIFGSEKDMEDAISVIEAHPEIKTSQTLKDRAKLYGVDNKLSELIKLLENNF